MLQVYNEMDITNQFTFSILVVWNRFYIFDWLIKASKYYKRCIKLYNETTKRGTIAPKYAATYLFQN